MRASRTKLYEVSFRPPRLPKMFLQHVYVYRTKDLQVDVKAFIELAALVTKCHGLCRLQGNRLWQLRDELLTDNRLASRLGLAGRTSEPRSVVVTVKGRPARMSLDQGMIALTAPSETRNSYEHPRDARGR